jgi:CHAD domain-containing protein
LRQFRHILASSDTDPGVAMDSGWSDRTERKRSSGVAGNGGIAVRAKTAKSRSYPRKVNRLGPTMTSERAFRSIARHCLDDLTSCQHKTSRGDFEALHQMRVSVTRLRAAVTFFSSMTSDPEWERLEREFKWLNSRLGAARDLDVIVKNSAKAGHHPAGVAPYSRALDKQWIDSHLRLAKALQSKRYRRLTTSAAAWIENGPWSMRDDERSKRRRLARISAYSAGVLGRWHKQICKRGRKLRELKADKRHRLRIRTKKLRYAVEWFGGLLPSQSPDWHRAMLKQLRKAQTCLGELNDMETARALARSSGKSVPAHGPLFDAKREKRLMLAAEAAYQKLGKLDPVWK